AFARCRPDSTSTDAVVVTTRWIGGSFLLDTDPGKVRVGRRSCARHESHRVDGTLAVRVAFSGAAVLAYETARGRRPQGLANVASNRAARSRASRSSPCSAPTQPAETVLRRTLATTWIDPVRVWTALRRRRTTSGRRAAAAAAV